MAELGQKRKREKEELDDEEEEEEDERRREEERKKKKKRRSLDNDDDDDDEDEEESRSRRRKNKGKEEEEEEEEGEGDRQDSGEGTDEDELAADLHPRLMDLLSLLFSTELLKKIAGHANVDLGLVEKKGDDWKSLSERIENAEAELRDIEEHLQDKEASGLDLADILLCSYNFYRFLPPVTRSVPPNISSSELIQEKRQVARVLRSVGELLKTKRLGAQYKALGCKLIPLAAASDEFQMIAKYAGTTNYPKVSCQIEEAFLIEPKHEVGKGVEKAAQKKLLWHGAILPLIPSILRSGFQLPPSESPKFPAGRAIYFSDVFSESLEKSKSFTIEECPMACLLLAEVDLDGLQTIRQREPSRKGPDPTMCLGRSYPDPNQKTTTASSATVPMGPIVPNGIAATDFEYNKYAIYDPNHARAKYLVRVKLTATNQPEKMALPKHLPFGVPAAKGIWTYESGKEWKRYSPELNQQLEDNYRNGKKFFHLKIGNVDYSVNLDHMCQFQTTQQSKSRRIKRT